MATMPASSPVPRVDSVPRHHAMCAAVSLIACLPPLSVRVCHSSCGARLADLVLLVSRPNPDGVQPHRHCSAQSPSAVFMYARPRCKMPSLLVCTQVRRCALVVGPVAARRDGEGPNVAPTNAPDSAIGGHCERRRSRRCARTRTGHDGGARA